MLLPPEFMLELDAESLNRFLDSLILGASGADSYSGDLEGDRDMLRLRIGRKEVMVEFSEEEETFRLLSRDEVRNLTEPPAKPSL
jgi:uncharacterized protein YheU (UPF0270 family)